MRRIKTVFGIVIMFFGMSITAYATESMNCWFPPEWKARANAAKTITDALTQESGLVIKPRIAKSYLEILRAFNSEEYSLVYVGSFVQAIFAKGP